MTAFQIAFAATGALIGTILLFWHRDRAALTKKMNALSDRQRELSAELKNFMEESEKLAAEFSRLLAGKQESSPATGVSTAGPWRGQERAKNKGGGLEKRYMVLSLAQQGHSAVAIAERLMIPSGEVELIVNLNQSKRTAVRRLA